MKEGIQVPVLDAYYVGIHRYQHKAGVPAKILGVKILMAPDGKTPRPCFHVRFPDGSEDYPMIENDRDIFGSGKFYKIILEEQIKAGTLPPVVH